MRAEEVFLLGNFLGHVAEVGALGKIKRVLRIARRVIGGRVERIEAVILGLDLGAFDDGEAGFAEDAAHFLSDECERMPRAGAGVRRRQRRIDGGPELRGDLGVADACEGGVELRL